MRHLLMFAVVGLLLHCSLVEGQSGAPASGAPAVTAAPGAPGASAGVTGSGAGSAGTCHVCSTNVTTDACATGPTGSGTGCANGVCIVVLEEDVDGNIVSLERKCHGQACNDDNNNSVFTAASTSNTGGTHYEECCSDAADCNTITYNDLKSTAGKLTAGLATILFGAIFLLVL